MHDILHDLDGVLCLIDNVFAFGKDKVEHDARLRAVLDRFRAANVTLNGKCELEKSCIKFAGHVVSGNGISPDPDRFAAVLNMVLPTDVSGMRFFLGMVTQLAKYSSSLAELSAPLHDLLHKDRAWTWDTFQQTVFDSLKKAIASAPILALHDPGRPTLVSADSLSYGKGAVLKQQHTTHHGSQWSSPHARTTTSNVATHKSKKSVSH